MGTNNLDATPQTFNEELSRQCRRLIFPSALIISVAWLPYIGLDQQLHPGQPLIPLLRWGLTVVGTLILILWTFRPLRRYGLTFMLAIAAYLELATAAITALSGADPAYIGGYLFIIMVAIIGPLRIFHTWGVLSLSLLTFFILLTAQGIDLSGPALQYSLRDLTATSLVAFVFSLLLNRVRYSNFIKSRRLDAERNRLERYNNTIRKELDLARRIQEQLIPYCSPVQYVEALYLPMTKLGGDFYDFFHFRDSDQLGVFLSDVSGHGVPAALLTSMLKSGLNQAGERRAAPEQLLRFLNGLLMGQMGHNFITAFCGIYEPAHHVLTFSSAGHTFPFLIGKESISLLRPGHNGLPLGILGNQELEDLEKQYQSHSCTFSVGQRLVLYTDGLSDACFRYSHDSLEELVRLEDVLFDLRALPPKEFLNQLMVRLVRERGHDRFTDDVCVICLDVR